MLHLIQLNKVGPNSQVNVDVPFSFAPGNPLDLVLDEALFALAWCCIDQDVIDVARNMLAVVVLRFDVLRTIGFLVGV